MATIDLSYLLLALLGASPHSTDVTIQSDVSYKFDNQPLPSSLKLEENFYKIHVDLSSFDQDNVVVRVVDSKNLKIEAKQYLVTVGGLMSFRRVTRQFPVPGNYDVNKVEASIVEDVLEVKVPGKRRNVLKIEY